MWKSSEPCSQPHGLSEVLKLFGELRGISKDSQKPSWRVIDCKESQGQEDYWFMLQFSMSPAKRLKFPTRENGSSGVECYE